jgi:hypothetical protein
VTKVFNDRYTTTNQMNQVAIMRQSVDSTASANNKKQLIKKLNSLVEEGGRNGRFNPITG